MKALAGFGSAKGSNEEAYLFQKLVRTGFGTNNVDHCTRLCHASSVAALMEGIGSGAVSATFNECKNSEVIFVIGANPTENHPVAATFFKQAAKRGSTLIVADPRGQALKRHAAHMMQFKPGTDVALLNGMLNTIVARSFTTSNTSKLMSKASSNSPKASRTTRRKRWRPSAASRPTSYARSRANSLDAIERRELNCFVDLGDDALHQGECFPDEIAVAKVGLTDFPGANAERIGSPPWRELNESAICQYREKPVQAAFRELLAAGKLGEHHAIRGAGEIDQDIEHAASRFDLRFFARVNDA